MWDFKKHILKTADNQAAPTCPDRAVVIQVCNFNSITDDNFNVFLNGTYIGFLNLQASAQVGSVMIATTDTSANVLVGDFACPLTLMQTYRFNPSLLLFGPNTLEMRNAQINGSGNAGTVSVRNYEVVDHDLINPCVVADLNYSGGDGVSFTMVFNYTACCPGEAANTIVAFKDTYTIPFGAGLSGPNVLVNDSLNGNSVTITNATVSQIFTSNALAQVNPTTGAITAATTLPIGTHTLVYEICQIGNPANCDQTTIKIIVTPAPPVDCVVSDWSDWSICTAGQQTRTRTVITPAANGGIACPALTETQPCTTVVLDPFDYMLITYNYRSDDFARDLDSATTFQNTGTAEDNKFVGCGQVSGYVTPTPTTALNSAYLYQGGDDAGNGLGESIVVNFKNLELAAISANNNVRVELYAGWCLHNTQVSGDIASVSARTYLGGTLTQTPGLNTITSNGTLVDTFARNDFPVISGCCGTNPLTGKTHIGTIFYNLVTKVASVTWI